MSGEYAGWEKDSVEFGRPSTARERYSSSDLRRDMHTKMYSASSDQLIYISSCTAESRQPESVLVPARRRL